LAGLVDPTATFGSIWLIDVMSIMSPDLFRMARRNQALAKGGW
jgi:hypothetical protein